MHIYIYGVYTIRTRKIQQNGGNELGWGPQKANSHDNV